MRKPSLTWRSAFCSMSALRRQISRVFWSYNQNIRTCVRTGVVSTANMPCKACKNSKSTTIQDYTNIRSIVYSQSLFRHKGPQQISMTNKILVGKDVIAVKSCAQDFVQNLSSGLCAKYCSVDLCQQQTWCRQQLTTSIHQEIRRCPVLCIPWS